MVGVASAKGGSAATAPTCTPAVMHPHPALAPTTLRASRRCGGAARRSEYRRAAPPLPYASVRCRKAPVGCQWLSLPSAAPVALAAAASGGGGSSGGNSGGGGDAPAAGGVVGGRSGGGRAANRLPPLAPLLLLW